ncbi:MAG TPA: protein kinase [Gemmatimonadales bacterium]|jgi:serine/threonine-protein kinase|nr:protein kinase [Gemmatimonadales bacterium]
MTDPGGHLSTALSDRYRIERELGAGGMATVYLAEDLRHDRKVAIKVLKPELSAVIGAARFLREIKTIATLQHPHILGLIDSGEVSGTAYYVMPFVEGESLRERLNRERQLPINDAVRLATEVAGALDYAHRHGVIHRDIKPENILLHDGSALVADFGIALAVSSAGGSSRMTETGMSLGTPHYMSPEQAMGEREITARSDIYALGCVLYEMLTGEPPFEGATAQAIVARVLTESPRPLRPQRKSVPPQVEAAVLTALEKLPADRFESAKAFAEALGDPAYAGTTSMQTRVMSSSAAARPGGRLRQWPVVAAAIAVVAAVAGLAAGWAVWHQRPPASPPTVLRYSVALPDSAAPIDAIMNQLGYAPDGSVFAYSSRLGVMLRYAERLDPVPVTGGRRGTAPFFSPDSRWLGFQTGGSLVKVPLAGGAPITICDSCTGYNFSWGSDDTIRYHTAPADNGSSRVLMAISARGGRPHEFARPERTSGEVFRSPMLLPGRRTVLFSVYRDAASRLASIDLRTGAITRLDQAGFGPQWVESGFLVLSNADGTLIALPLDPARVRPTGPPVAIARDVSQPDAYSPRAAVSAEGSFVYPRAGGAVPRRLMLVSRSGQATPLIPDPKAFANPRFSPDGHRVVFDISDAATSSRDVWVLDVAQRVWSRLTTNGISDRPIWTRDGQRVVYSSNDDLWWIAADGSGRPDSLLVSVGNRFAGSVTPDGRALVFQETGGGLNGIRAMVFDSAPAARTILPAAFDESAPALSPDGHWLAYQSDQTGQMEVYVRSYPEPGARVSVSLQGGSEPVWAHNGRELFYRSGDSLLVASVTLSPAFAVTARRLLFTGSFLNGGTFREYDVAPDDQHFVMISGGAAQTTLIGVQNVFQRLLYDGRQQR